MTEGLSEGVAAGEIISMTAMNAEMITDTSSDAEIEKARRETVESHELQWYKTRAIIRDGNGEPRRQFTERIRVAWEVEPQYRIQFATRLGDDCLPGVAWHIISRYVLTTPVSTLHFSLSC